MNNVNYIKTNNDTLILQLSTGAKQLTRHDFNFNKILKLLPTTEDVITPLLKTPELPNGKFLLYGDKQCLYAKQYTDDGQCIRHALVGKHVKSKSPVFLGVYASIEDIKLDFPEHFI
jgi:hypothetical protein